MTVADFDTWAREQANPGVRASGERELAAATRDKFTQVADAIRQHPDLSPEAKRRYLAQALIDARDKIAALRADEEARDADVRAGAQRALYQAPVPRNATADQRLSLELSYRDAVARAEQAGAGGTDELRRLYASADRRGDSLLARAAATVAVDHGLADVADHYAAENPDAGGALQTLARLEAYRTSRQERMAASFAYSGPTVPDELRAVDDQWRLAAVAEGEM